MGGDIDEVEKESSRRAKKGLKIIKQMAKSTVPVKVFETLKEERNRVQGDPSYYGDGYYDSYNNSPRQPRRSRLRRGELSSGRRRRRALRTRQPSITKESLFGEDAEGLKNVYYNRNFVDMMMTFTKSIGMML